eukprot:12985127-Ditylum_brightwellii.AAC.1
MRILLVLVYVFEIEVGISKDDLRAASASKASNDGQVSLHFFVLLFELYVCSRKKLGRLKVMSSS